MNLRGANKTMVSKLVVIAIGMFGFGYALIPIYKQICEITGVNILALSENQNANWTAGKGSKPANTQHT